MNDLPERAKPRKSTLSLLDDALLVVVAVVGALIVLRLVGAIVATVWFVVKVAFVAAFVFVVLQALRGFRSRER